MVYKSFVVKYSSSFAAMMKRWVNDGAFREETLYGISLLNEPAGWNEWIWKACKEEFYPRGKNREVIYS